MTIASYLLFSATGALVFLFGYWMGRKSKAVKWDDLKWDDWHPIAKNQSIHGLDAIRDMAKRNGVIFDESDFSQGEIMIFNTDEYAIKLGGAASAFVYYLGLLNDGSITLEKFEKIRATVFKSSTVEIKP